MSWGSQNSHGGCYPEAVESRCGKKTLTQITEIQGDSVGNPQRDTKKLEEEFPPLGTGFSLTVEVSLMWTLK